MKQFWFLLTVQTFPEGLLPHTLQNVPVEILVNLTAWRNNFPMNNAITVKQGDLHALYFPPDLPRFIWVWRARAFPLTGLLFGFLIVTVNADIVSSYHHRH
jgi:hypothetical protein